MFIYLLVVFLNLCGVDDKNIIFFLTSPFMWIAETHWFAVNFMHPSKISASIYYIINTVIWFLFGLALDLLLLKFKNRK